MKIKTKGKNTQKTPAKRYLLKQKPIAEGREGDKSYVQDALMRWEKLCGKESKKDQIETAMYVQMIHSSNPANIRDGLIALSVRKHMGEFKKICSLLTHSAEYVRREAAYTLGELKDPKSIPYLDEAAKKADKSGDTYVLVDVIVALKKIHTQETKSILERYQNHVNKYVRRKTQDALRSWPCRLPKSSTESIIKLSKNFLETKRNGSRYRPETDREMQWRLQVANAFEKLTQRRDAYIAAVKKGQVLTDRLYREMVGPRSGEYTKLVYEGKVMTSEVLLLIENSKRKMGRPKNEQ